MIVGGGGSGKIEKKNIYQLGTYVPVKKNKPHLGKKKNSTVNIVGKKN